MSWIYQVLNGALNRGPAFVGTGYSGTGLGRDNPAYESQANVGPIPRGVWYVTGLPFDSPTHGPYCLRLTPSPDTEVFGRSGFLIHGDSKLAPGTASKGCIILPRGIRELIWMSGERLLVVI